MNIATIVKRKPSATNIVKTKAYTTLTREEAQNFMDALARSQGCGIYDVRTWGLSDRREKPVRIETCFPNRLVECYYCGATSGRHIRINDLFDDDTILSLVVNDNPPWMWTE